MLFFPFLFSEIGAQMLMQRLYYSHLGRTFASSLLTLTLPTSALCETVTAGKQTVLFFFIFITALKSIGDSRLDEHEAFLQLPCRCRLAKIH